jgi:signal transduction histidine kinase
MKKLDRTFDAAFTSETAAARSERAAQRIAALGEMTGGIAHDFRNILAVIEAGLRLAERNIADPTEARACLARARDGVERGLQLTSQLLTFAKQQELEPRPCDVNDLLRSFELLLKYAAGPGVHITLELSSVIPKCLVDPPQFSAAVLNLVVNARDAMPEGGEVRISTALSEAGSSKPACFVRVRVKDNGQGMPEDVLQRIFDPLFTTKGEKGTGLGLPHVCAFMRLVGGHVEVTSEPTEGSTFDLLFPVVMPDR